MFYLFTHYEVPVKYEGASLPVLLLTIYLTICRGELLDFTRIRLLDQLILLICGSLLKRGFCRKLFCFNFVWNFILKNQFIINLGHVVSL